MRTDRQRLRQALACAAQTAPTQLHLACRGAFPASADLLRQSRLMLVLRGRHDVEIGQADGSRCQVRLQRGTALHLPGGAWIQRDPRLRFRLFGIVFHDKHLRFLINDHDPVQGNRPARIWHHTTAPLSMAGRHIMLALELLQDRPADDPERSVLFQALLLHCLQQLDQDDVERSMAGKDLYNAILEFLTEHCHKELTRDAVAADFAIHPNHLSRLFRRHGESSFNRSLIGVRLERAADILRQVDCPIAEVAKACGYSSSSYFVNAFRKKFGCSPGRYRHAAG